MRKYISTYSDYKDRPTTLTETQLKWFFENVDRARKATGVTVDIIPWDHDTLSGKNKDALGITYTQDPNNTLGEGVDTYITIDCYYIDECWRHEFDGDYLISGEVLLHTIAHEIAHLTVWRHGKRHTNLTEKLYEQIMAA